MEARAFIDNYSQIVSAPNGIQKLRELILKLAVRGKIETQDVNDEPASVLLEKIIEENTRMLREGRAQIHKPPQEIQDYEKQIILPQGWVFARNVDLFSLRKGKKPKTLSSKNIGSPYLDIEALDRGSITRYTDDEKCPFSTDDDILVVCDGSRSGLVLNGRIGVVGSTLAVIDAPKLIKPYVRLLFQEAFQRLNTSMKGAAIPHLDTKNLLNDVVGLPPLNEQRRIVAKVDQLMALCDQLENQRTQLTATRSKTSQAVLNALVHSETDDQLGIAWSRLTENFSELLQDQSGIDALRETILGLAYEGRLTRQWRVKERPNMGAHTLIEEIQSKRDRGLAKADGQREKELLQVKKKLARQKIEDPADPIPQGWEWVTLIKVSELMVDCHNKTAPYVHQGVHLVRTTDIRNGVLDLRYTKKVSQDTYEFWSRRCPPESGDIIFTREAPMGEAAIVPPNETVCLGQRTMLIRIFEEFVDREYLLYALYEAKFKERMLKAAIGMTVKHLRVGDVEDLVIPLSPLDEQKEIVRQIKKYFSYCEQLSDGLRQRSQTQNNLALASVNAVLNMPRIVTRVAKDTIVLTDGAKPVIKRWKSIPSVVLSLVETMKKRIADSVLARTIQANGSSMDAKELWQKSGLSIDDFYAALKQEIKDGFIAEPEAAQLKLIEVTD